jgi:hypothetical protein
VVHWNEYEALRDHLQRQKLNATNPLHEGVQDVELGLKDATETISDTQRQVTEVQQMMVMAKQVYKVVVMLTPPMLVIILLVKLVAVVMEVVVVAVLGAVEAVDLLPNVCVVNDDPNFAQPVHRDGVGKPKFTMPKFVGCTDVEEYLNWELKVEKLWRMHEYTEDKKIKLATSEFDDYSLICGTIWCSPELKMVIHPLLHGEP